MSSGKVLNMDLFLNNVAKSLGRERRRTDVTLPNWSKKPQYEVYKEYNQEQLVDQLVQQCSRIHTKVEITTVDELPDVLNTVLDQFEAKKIVSWDDPRNSEYQLNAYYNKCEENGKIIHIWDSSMGDENIKIAESAHVGITFADMALAESATVVLFSDKGKGRSVSLLPENYVAIIPKSKIVPRMTQATTKIHKQVKAEGEVASCINFISGPSNSADIEMNLVVGVHGPIKAFYIIIEDK